MDDIVQHLIQDAKEHAVSPILQFMKKQPAISIPISSPLYENCDYWFGVKPIMIEEKDSVAPYISVELNLKSHEEFLHQVMSKVSIIDYMEIQRELCNKSPEMKILEKNLRETTEMYLKIQEDYVLYKEKIEKDLDAYKQTVDEMNGGRTLAEMTRELETLHRTNRKMDDRLVVLSRENERLRKYSEPIYRSETDALDAIKMEELYIQRIESLQEKLTKTREELQTEKDKNRKVKESTRKNEKDVEKIKAERQKVKREMKEAKKRMKALEKSLSSSSDSDSDSD
jgi:chromosome segregation ATPase